MPLPSYLILPMQVALQSQGVPAEAISPQGEIDWSTIISNVVTDVELRTTVLPPYKIHLPDALKPAPPSAAMQFLKPTLIMSGKIYLLPFVPAIRSKDPILAAMPVQ